MEEGGRGRFSCQCFTLGSLGPGFDSRQGQGFFFQKKLALICQDLGSIPGRDRFFSGKFGFNLLEEGKKEEGKKERGRSSCQCFTLGSSGPGPVRFSAGTDFFQKNFLC